MSQHHDEKPHLPAAEPLAGRLRASASRACSSASSSAGPSSPSAPRSHSSSASSGCATSRATWPPRRRSSPSGARSPTAPPSSVEDEAASRDGEREAYPRSRSSRSRRSASARVIGGLVTLPVLGFAVLPAFTNQGSPDADLGPLANYPEGQCRDRDVHRATRARRGVAADRVRPVQRPARGRAELHDPLEPLRPPRLPRAAERPDRRRTSRRTDGRQTLG